MKLLRATILTVFVLSALSTTGCVKLKQVWTINPDGSGKMTATVGINQRMLSRFGDNGMITHLENPAEIIDQQDRGWVAFTRPEISTREGFKYATFTCYFEDINEITFRGDGGYGEMTASSYRFGEGTFSVQDGTLIQAAQAAANDPVFRDKSANNLVVAMIEGMEMVEQYHLPGTVSEAEGFDVEGKQASVTLRAADLTADTPPTIAGAEDSRLDITFEPTGWGGGKAQWEAELEQAKTQWEAIKAEARAKAEAER
ncbi:MAG: hypothetical protein AAGG38_02255 [Planctomycetota bacterium]